MAQSSEKWSDLVTRVVSGVAMVAVGLVCMWRGGFVFDLLVAVVCGLMMWELVGMLRAANAQMRALIAAAAGVALLLSAYLPVWLGLPLVMAPVFLGFSQLRQRQIIFLAFSVMIMLAGFGLMMVRGDMGFGWLLWLVAVVVVTDVAGYFAGRAFGGPKFWPRISPKKTWSGTVAGWVGAALVGVLFSINAGIGLQLVGVSVALSMASQMGDIAESAIKRRMGVKDSSNLIPGHGGLMDRFDGLLGASVFLLIIAQFIGFPPGLA